MGKLGLETISTFSLSHLIYVGIALVLIVLLNLILLKASSKAKKAVIFVLSLLGFFALVGTVVYKYLTISNFDIFANLPITLCGVGFIFGMLFSLTNVESMKSFVGYAGIFAGLYGLLAIPHNLIGSLSFDLQTILYFAPYIILLVMAVSIFTFKLSRPTYKNMGISIITLILVTCFIHVINVAFTIYDITAANYFMTLSPSRDMVSRFVYKYINYELVYLFAYLVAFVILSSVISLFSLKTKEKLATYAIEEDNVKNAKASKEKVQKVKAKKLEQEEKAEPKEVVETQVEEVSEPVEHFGIPMGNDEASKENNEEWEDVIPEVVLEKQVENKKDESSTIDDIIIKDEEIEQVNSKKQEKELNPNVLMETDKQFVESKQENIVMQNEESSKLENVVKKPAEKDYQTYVVKEKPTQVQRKYSFAESDRKRKNDPTLGVSSTKRSASQNTELLKDLKYRIDRLGK